MNSTRFLEMTPQAKNELLCCIHRALFDAEKENCAELMQILISYIGASKFLTLECNKPFKKIIQKLATLHNQAPAHFCPSLRALVCDEFTYAEIQSLGFNLTLGQYRYSLASNNLKVQVYNPSETQESRSIDMARNVINFCLAFSELGGDTFHKNLGPIFQKVASEPDNNYSTSCTYLLNLNRNQLFTIFNLGRKQSGICQRTFYKYAAPNFIHSKKRTDLCTLCYKGSLVQIAYNDIPHPPDVVTTLETLQLHRECIYAQKQAFDDELEALSDDSIMLILDFKENIAIGGSLNEVNQIFFNKSSISVLGFAVISKKNEVLSVDYFDFLSSILNHDSRFSGECLIKLLSQTRFRAFQRVSIWSDNGPHFRSHEFLYYSLHLVPKIFSGPVTFSRFCEYHGKNLVDGHFGVLSNTLKTLENKYKYKLSKI